MVLKRLQQGGVEELTAIFEENRSALRKMIRNRISGLISSRFDESDVIQDAFMRAASRLESYLNCPNVHPSVWIRILCRQLLSEQARKQLLPCRNPGMESDFLEGEQAIQSLIDSTDSVGTKMGRREVVSQLLESLTETDREILGMRHSEGMVFREIAESLEMKIDAVKKRYYRAIQTLDEITEQGDSNSETLCSQESS